MNAAAIVPVEKTTTPTENPSAGELKTVERKMLSPGTGTGNLVTPKEKAGSLVGPATVVKKIPPV
jgi:hypothetical protein